MVLTETIMNVVFEDFAALGPQGNRIPVGHPLYLHAVNWNCCSDCEGVSEKH